MRSIARTAVITTGAGFRVHVTRRQRLTACSHNAGLLAIMHMPHRPNLSYTTLCASSSSWAPLALGPTLRHSQEAIEDSATDLAIIKLNVAFAAAIIGNHLARKRRGDVERARGVAEGRRE